MDNNNRISYDITVNDTIMSVEKKCRYCGVGYMGNPKSYYCSTNHRVLDYRRRTGAPATPWASERAIANDLKQLLAVNREMETEIKALKATISMLESKHLGTTSEIQPKTLLVEHFGPVVVDTPVSAEIVAQKPQNQPQNEPTGLKLGTIKQYFGFQMALTADELSKQGFVPKDFYETIRQGHVSPIVKHWQHGDCRFRAVQKGKKWSVEMVKP